MSKTLWAILLFQCYSNLHGELYGYLPEVYMSFEERVRSHGYPIEAHRVETEDDYILSLYRIPHGLSKTNTTDKDIVLMLHGMGGTPQNFVAIGRRRAAPYYFADREMDVWVFASRGSEGSFNPKHKKYDWNKDEVYWEFSLHEIGKYDLSAVIDYILNCTGRKKLSMIGYSAGAPESFILLSEKPEYNEKITVAISWGSSPILRKMDYPLVWVGVETIDLWKGLANLIGMVEYVPTMQLLKPVAKAFCADRFWQKFCVMGAWVIGSRKSLLLHPDDIQVISSAVPRLSIRQIFHFGDNVRNGSFRRYDYGSKQNMKLYGQTYPPHYNLSVVTAPTAFFVGAGDRMAVLEDIHESVSHLSNTVMIYQIPFPEFNHLDFAFGRNSTYLLYEPTLRLMKDLERGRKFPPIRINKKYG